MKNRINEEIKERVKSIIMSGEKCTFGNKSVFDCHCNDCYDHIIEYLGKKKGKKYFYNGKFTPEYMRNKYIIIKSFCADEEDKTSSCECLLHMADKDYGYEWIPREEIINNLIEVSSKNTSEKEEKKNDK